MRTTTNLTAQSLYASAIFLRDRITANGAIRQDEANTELLAIQVFLREILILDRSAFSGDSCTEMRNERNPRYSRKHEKIFNI